MNENGFTLIEIIIGILLISIAAALLTTGGSQWLNSADALNTMSDNYAVVRAIEIVNADYRNRLSTGSGLHNINVYIGTISGAGSQITGLSALSDVSVTGVETSFSAPNVATKKVTENASTSNSGYPEYVLVTAQKNNSRMVTLLAN